MIDWQAGKVGLTGSFGDLVIKDSQNMFATRSGVVPGCATDF